MTWSEFKAKVEAGGVKDEDQLDYIDWQDDAVYREPGTVELEQRAYENGRTAWTIT